MTTEEAQNKRCCVDLDRFCFREFCMAWRWVDLCTKLNGYCGLAGKEGAE